MSGAQNNILTVWTISLYSGRTRRYTCLMVNELTVSFGSLKVGDTFMFLTAVAGRKVDERSAAVEGGNFYFVAAVRPTEPVIVTKTGLSH
jgi:hypothetical protein